jgi:hypothetical protein
MYGNGIGVGRGEGVTCGVGPSEGMSCGVVPGEGLVCGVATGSATRFCGLVSVDEAPLGTAGSW